MITVNRGEVEVKGTPIEMIGEFNNLVTILLKDEPEIVLATLINREQEMEETILTSSTEKLRLYSKICASYVKCVIKGEDFDGI